MAGVPDGVPDDVPDGGGHEKARAMAGDRIAKSPRDGGLCVRLWGGGL
jgi:hypothetical protein